MENKITEFLKEGGAAQVGFCRAADNPFDLPFAISYTIPLSDAIVDGIVAEPTHTYFHHYRSVNALSDNLSLRCGLLLAENGYKYVPVPASQSVNGMQGIYSHKMAAVAAGLGSIGKSALFISEKNGPRVRLGTILTDYRFTVAEPEYKNVCGECTLCRDNCPAMAIKGNTWSEDCTRGDIIDAMACSEYMKREFKHIGRGVVCGICMKICPHGKKNNG